MTTRWAILLILATGAISGCGGAPVSCGDGTIEVDGKCVAAPGTIETDDDGGGGGGGGGGGDGQDGPLTSDPAVVQLESAVPCEAIKTVTVTNDGPGAQVIDLVYLEPAFTGLTLDPPPDTPFTLPEGDSFDVVVKAVAEDPVDGASTLVIASQREIYLEIPLEVDLHLEHVIEDFEAGGTPMVDVLLLIDHSCSMEYIQDAELIVGIPAMIGELDAGSDWQLIQVTREDGCSNGGVHDGTEANLEAYLLNHAWDKLAGYTYGINYLTEALLELGSLALDQTDAGECNEGFLRPGAALQVVVVSDEPEQSGVSWVAWGADYAGYDPDVVVSGVVDESGLCAAGGAGGYIDAINASGGTALEICSLGWGSSMDTLIDASGSGSSSFSLSSDPDPASIEVTVDGDPADFTYDSLSNTIELDDPPADGAQIEVTYDAESATCG